MKKFIEALNIFAKYFPDGLDTNYFMSAEHDIIYIHVSIFDLPEEYEDGKKLKDIGFSTDNDYWCKYV